MSLCALKYRPVLCSVSSVFELSLLGWREIHKSFPKSMWKLKDVSGAPPPAEKKNEEEETLQWNSLKVRF